jgi:glycosyltransferase involved in cell wall biosynthesis
MTRDKLLGLQSVCDCFVSLHRSEGFGRNIAESMLLGKPVIVSDYSGNQDFTNEETAFLVGGSLVPLSAGDYAFFHNQNWFEPQVDIASGMFRICLEFPEVRKRKALAGQSWIKEHYSPERVGKAYKLRLDELYKKECPE